MYLIAFPFSSFRFYQSFFSTNISETAHDLCTIYIFRLSGPPCVFYNLNSLPVFSGTAAYLGTRIARSRSQPNFSYHIVVRMFIYIPWIYIRKHLFILRQSIFFLLFNNKEDNIKFMLYYYGQFLDNFNLLANKSSKRFNHG